MIIVSYQLEQFRADGPPRLLSMVEVQRLDARIRKLLGRKWESTGSGMGFGMRDLEFDGPGLTVGEARRKLACLKLQPLDVRRTGRGK